MRCPSDGADSLSFIFCGTANVLACVIAATASRRKRIGYLDAASGHAALARNIVVGKLLGILRRLLPLHHHHPLLLFWIGGYQCDHAVVIRGLTFTTNVIWVVTGCIFSSNHGSRSRLCEPGRAAVLICCRWSAGDRFSNTGNSSMTKRSACMSLPRTWLGDQPLEQPVRALAVDAGYNHCHRGEFLTGVFLAGWASGGERGDFVGDDPALRHNVERPPSRGDFRASRLPVDLRNLSP